MIQQQSIKPEKATNTIYALFIIFCAIETEYVLAGMLRPSSAPYTKPQNRGTITQINLHLLSK